MRDDNETLVPLDKQPSRKENLASTKSTHAMVMGEMSAGRELAKTRLRRLVESQRRRLAGLEALLRVAEQAEDGSPLEEALWDLSCNRLER